MLQIKQRVIKNLIKILLSESVTKKLITVLPINHKELTRKIISQTKEMMFFLDLEKKSLLEVPEVFSESEEAL